MKKGFTLTEIMIALAVIAILTVILMPMIFKLRPNQEVLMTKRAYYQTLTIVSEMINNEKCYPLVYDRTGFGDERPYTCSQNGGGNRNVKFRELFKEYLNPIATTASSATTKDSMSWTISSRFTQNGGHAIITVDTSGSNVSREHDTFSMNILPNGKVEITGVNAEWARAAVQTDKKFVGND